MASSVLLRLSPSQPLTHAKNVFVNKKLKAAKAPSAKVAQRSSDGRAVTVPSHKPSRAAPPRSEERSEQDRQHLEIAAGGKLPGFETAGDRDGQRE